MGDPDNIWVRWIEYVDVIDAYDDIADAEAGNFGRGTGFDGRNDDWTWTVDPKSKFTRLPPDQNDIITF